MLFRSERMRAQSHPSAQPFEPTEAAVRLSALLPGAAAPPSPLSTAATPFAAPSAVQSTWAHLSAPSHMSANVARARRASLADVFASGAQPHAQWQYQQPAGGAVPASLIEWAEQTAARPSGCLDSGQITSGTLSPHAPVFAQSSGQYGDTGHLPQARWSLDAATAAAMAGALPRVDSSRQAAGGRCHRTGQSSARRQARAATACRS